MKASDVEGIVKGKLLRSGHDHVVDNLLTDSRKITHPGSSLFIPLVTARRNAHHFLPAVYEAGVRCFLVSDEPDIALYENAWIIKVDQTLTAMQQLVAWHRAQFDIPVIGVTGSNGKTIVKEWLYQLLEPDYRVLRSPKSYNSQIGVPLSVWELKPEYTLAIFEAGISQAGEMEHLEKIIKPTGGIFTNIGETHNEGFLNLRHKINEKLILFRHAQWLIYCKDYHELHDCILQVASQLKNNTGHDIQLISWSRKTEADLQIHAVTKEAGFTRVQGNYQGASQAIRIPFTDEASIEDAIHCWLTMLHLGIAHVQIQARMEKLQHIAMRLELMRGIHHSTLINDSYNSDVSSFAIALDLLVRQQQHEEKTVILSDILQSGRDNELYDEVAELIRQKKIKRFIGIGEALYRNKNIFRLNRNLHSTFYKTTEEFLQQMDSTSFENQGILIKGARKFSFEKIAKRLEERIHQTVLEIHLDALVHNLNQYKALLQPNTRIMAMVKAFSYGSGSYEIASKLQFERVDYLAVAYTDEGILLRKHGITLPILVMNADEHTYDLLMEWDLEPELFNMRTLQKFLQVVQAADKLQYPVHLKLDTGMHRLGFEEQDLHALTDVLLTRRELKVVSVFSHLSGSEEEEWDDFTRLQASRFEHMTALLAASLPYSFLRHLCNSSAIVRHPELHYDMVRPGLGLYGMDGSGQMQHALREMSRLKTVIAQIKHVAATETVGYNRKGKLQRDTIIGTVCVGYADGVPRRLGNGVGAMWVKDRLAPIVGNICMDMCMLDLTDIPGIEEGDEVLVFGDQLPVSQLARWASTIPYEILTGISQRVKRVYYEA